MNKKLQRILLTIVLSVLSIPILLRLIIWIMVPGNYDSDGVTDLGYGFISFFCDSSSSLDNYDTINLVFIEEVF